MATSPISNIPYDILREIFIFCQCTPPPPSSLLAYRPVYSNSIIPIIILTHVCSFWRTVALSIPTLWTELRMYIPVNYSAGSLQIHRKDIDFFKWWKRNQGSSIPPALTIDIHNDMYPPFDVGRPFVRWERYIPFMMKYVSKAQYLDLHPYLWTELRSRSIVCPNLETIRLSPSEEGKMFGMESSVLGFMFFDAQAVLSRIPPPSKLRYLQAEKGHLSLLDNIIDPVCWSTSTHLSIRSVSMTLSFWYALLRAVSGLQWACFDIDSMDADLDKTSLDIYISLNYLYNLTIECRDNKCDITTLFEGVSLPALHVLSLVFRCAAWRSHTIAPQIHTLLLSMPSITTLSLGPGFMGFGSKKYDREPLCTADPLCMYAPNLRHLEMVAFTYPRLIPKSSRGNAVLCLPADKLKRLVELIFDHENRWLAPTGPACPIHTITIVCAALDSIPMDELDAIRDMVKRDAQNIDLRFVSKSVGELASDVCEKRVH
ncbi:hypothetical protein BDN70DRAFT_964893 [Pholiota conissans]|uniref:F-box domain-containing protein n=1 Tax=Pholiota conissans TaxID=109636 RepID=A0A9P6CVE8_9AGAR|nr:hypothetical protein BDN70DRAFT_964893 [Pholiota conissans]